MMRPLFFSSSCQGLPKLVKRLSDRDPRFRRDLAALRQHAAALRRATRRPGPSRPAGRKQRAILPVPAGQPEILVEDGDALLHLVERDLQEVAIVLQRLGRVVEQAEGVARGAVVTLEQQRQDEPRRGGADGAGQQLFGKADDRHGWPARCRQAWRPPVASKVWNERSVRSTPR